MSRHFKIDDVLPEDQRTELVALVRQRSTTVDIAWAWLRKRGYKISRGAVHNWMKEVKAEGSGASVRAELLATIGRMTDDEVTGVHDCGTIIIVHLKTEQGWTDAKDALGRSPKTRAMQRAARDSADGGESSVNPGSTQV